LVVYLFLQDFKSTLIPAIAVPVAIIGTFLLANIWFSINMLTLFAMILVIGIVVDDAIVVVEAVHAKLDEGAKSAKEATLSAMSETRAIISYTCNVSGIYSVQQFAVTLAIAILISAVNALTLSPALCALLLKPHTDSKHRNANFKERFSLLSIQILIE
jgi:HAE1 family hydrophobic/amphiphilic exporter-1